MRIAKILVNLGILVLMLSSSAMSAIIYVDASRPNDLGDGLSWDYAKKTIQAGITAAMPSGTVRVKQGNYTGKVTMAAGINVEGAYTGEKDANNNDIRDLNNWNTTITNSGDCVVMYPLSTTGNLDHFAITGGIGYSSNGNRYGGGIYCLSSPTISNCRIYNNSARFGGGIYAAVGTHPTISNCTIENNNGDPGTGVASYGIGIYFYGGTLTNNTIQNNAFRSSGTGSSGGGIYFASYYSGGNGYTNNHISGNGANNVASSSGGGIYMSNGSPGPTITTTDSQRQITGNKAYYGAGIYSISPGTISGYTISNNTASSSSGYGGGIYVSSHTASLNIQDDTISGNSAYNGGGIYYSGSGNITHNTISGNSATNGGGIFYDGTGPISRNTITSNSGSNGAAVYWNASSTYPGTIYSNIISNHSANPSSSGSVHVSALQAQSKFVNNTVVNNNSSAGVYLSNPASSSTLSNNIITSGSIGIKNTGSNTCTSNHNWFYNNTTNYSTYVSDSGSGVVDPLLDSNNHLTTDSPCIDAGDDNVVGTGWLDIDGQNRKFDYPFVDTSRTVDIGADERYPDFATEPVLDRGLPSANVNNDVGANRTNYRWADTVFNIGYGDSFVFPQNTMWVITKVVAWTVPDVPVDPVYFLGDYYSGITLYLGSGSLSAVATGALSTGSYETSNGNIIISRDHYGTNTNYQAADGTDKQIWKIEFNNLNTTISANTTAYLGVMGTPRFDRLWFNHASTNLRGGGSLCKFDTNALGTFESVSGSGWIGKETKINIQVYAHPQ